MPFSGSEKLLNDMHRAVRDGDAPLFQYATHALKGNASGVGAIHLYKACYNAEKNVSTVIADTNLAIVDGIQEEFNRAIHSLKQYLALNNSHQPSA